MKGFEPLTSWLQTKHSDQTELHPDKIGVMGRFELHPMIHSHLAYQLAYHHSSLEAGVRIELTYKKLMRLLSNHYSNPHVDGDGEELPLTFVN